MIEKRAVRRADLARMKAKAHRIFGKYNPEGSHGKLANHLAHCAGFCCANPRRFYGKRTLKETQFLCDDGGMELLA